MMSILAVPRPLPDELLLSWAHRSADANGLSMPVFSGAYCGSGGGTHGILPCDFRGGFPELLYSLGLEDRMSDIYLGLSTFRFESVVMTPGRQARYAANVFYPADGLNPPVNTLFNAVKICPDCVRDDKEAFGFPYLRRSHQLSGVHVCYKHGTPLRKFEGIRGHECEFIEGDYVQERSEQSEADMQAYAGYAHLLLKSGPGADAYTVKRAIFKKMGELGYGVSDSYESFLDDFEGWEHSGLWNGGDIVRFLKVKLISADHLSIEEVLPLVMFLFPDAEDFIHALGNSGSLLEQHICPVCGEVYCRTASIDFGCPSCNKGVPEDERFRRMVKAASDGAYEPLEPFVSLDKKLRFRHTACGKEVSIKPRGFIFEDIRCMCEYTVSEDEARRAVEANEGFKLIDYMRTEGPVTVYHETCGREFTCKYRKFIQFPGCRACNPPDMTAELFRERVSELTGGEYEVVSDFVDQQTPVEILHTVCGRTQSYLPRHFISDQQRCHACGKMPAWEESFMLLKQYKAEHGSVNVPKKESYKGYSLGRWCQGQRDRHKKGVLTEEQVRRLEEIGFAWDSLEAEWRENCERYRRYIEQNGSPYIPRRMDFEGVHLGAWVDTQRKRMKEGKLSKQRETLLLQVNPELFNERS